jgi:hypothetical protein
MRKLIVWGCVLVFVLMSSVISMAQNTTPTGRIAYIGIDEHVYVQEMAQGETLTFEGDSLGTIGIWSFE